MAPPKRTSTNKITAILTILEKNKQNTSEINQLLSNLGALVNCADSNVSNTAKDNRILANAIINILRFAATSPALNRAQVTDVAQLSEENSQEILIEEKTLNTFTDSKSIRVFLEKTYTGMKLKIIPNQKDTLVVLYNLVKGPLENEQTCYTFFVSLAKELKLKEKKPLLTQISVLATRARIRTIENEIRLSESAANPNNHVKISINSPGEESPLLVTIKRNDSYSPPLLAKILPKEVNETLLCLKMLQYFVISPNVEAKIRTGAMNAISAYYCLLLGPAQGQCSEVEKKRWKTYCKQGNENSSASLIDIYVNKLIPGYIFQISQNDSRNTNSAFKAAKLFSQAMNKQIKGTGYWDYYWTGYQGAIQVLNNHIEKIKGAKPSFGRAIRSCGDTYGISAGASWQSRVSKYLIYNSTQNSVLSLMNILVGNNNSMLLASWINPTLVNAIKTGAGSSFFGGWSFFSALLMASFSLGSEYYNPENAERTKEQWAARGFTFFLNYWLPGLATNFSLGQMNRINSSWRGQVNLNYIVRTLTALFTESIAAGTSAKLNQRFQTGLRFQQRHNEEEFTEIKREETNWKMAGTHQFLLSGATNIISMMIPLLWPAGSFIAKINTGNPGIYPQQILQAFFELISGLGAGYYLKRKSHIEGDCGLDLEKYPRNSADNIIAIEKLGDSSDSDSDSKSDSDED